MLLNLIAANGRTGVGSAFYGRFDHSAAKMGRSAKQPTLRVRAIAFAGQIHHTQLQPCQLGLGNGARRRIRTTDTRIFNPLLYQLSYPGIQTIILAHNQRWTSAYRGGLTALSSLNSSVRLRIRGLTVLHVKRRCDSIALVEPGVEITIAAPPRTEGPECRVDWFVA